MLAELLCGATSISEICGTKILALSKIKVLLQLPTYSLTVSCAIWWDGCASEPTEKKLRLHAAQEDKYIIIIILLIRRGSESKVLLNISDKRVQLNTSKTLAQFLPRVILMFLYYIILSAPIGLSCAILLIVSIIASVSSFSRVVPMSLYFTPLLSRILMDHPSEVDSFIIPPMATSATWTEVCL